MTGGRQVPRGRERLPASRRAGGRPGRPADSLIAPGGRVPAAGYGEHVYDRWPVDEPPRPAAAGEPAAAAR